MSFKEVVVDSAMPNSALAPEDVLAIYALIEPWNDAVKQKDWDAVQGMCTDDMVFMPPEGLPVQGETVRSFLEALPPVKSMWWNIEDTHGQGDLAAVWGSVKETVVIDGADVLVDGKYCDVLRKGADGKWRFAVIIWNSNVPA